jgi:hypothetical protein
MNHETESPRTGQGNGGSVKTRPNYNAFGVARKPAPRCMRCVLERREDDGRALFESLMWEPLTWVILCGEHHALLTSHHLVTLGKKVARVGAREVRHV